MKRARHISKDTNFEQKGALAKTSREANCTKTNPTRHGRLSLNADKADST